jgi:hypothetical protein
MKQEQSWTELLGLDKMWESTRQNLEPGRAVEILENPERFLTGRKTKPRKRYSMPTFTARGRPQSPAISVDQKFLGLGGDTFKYLGPFPFPWDNRSPNLEWLARPGELLAPNSPILQYFIIEDNKIDMSLLLFK